MRNLYLSITFLLCGTAIFAQSNDPAAKQVLDAVSAKFQTFKTVQAGFNYRAENSAGKGSNKLGTILMKGTKYKVVFGNQEIFCDGKTVWSLDKSAKEVTISNLDAAQGTLTPQKLFTNFYDKDFLYILNGEKKTGAKTYQEIEMTPTDKSKAFHKVYVQVDKTAKTIHSTKVLLNDGNRYTYTVSNMKTNVPATDAQFVFDKAKYPGVEEVDLR